MIIPYIQLKKACRLVRRPAGAGNIARIAAGYAGHAGRPNLNLAAAIGRRGRLWGALSTLAISTLITVHTLFTKLEPIINRPLCMRHIVASSFNHREVS